MNFNINELDEEDSEKAKELYVDEGLHLAGVADRVGVEPETLRDHLVDEGVGLDTNDIPQDADLGERIDLLRDPHDDPVVLRELRERGYDAGDIADDLDASEHIVEQNMERHQVGSATLFDFAEEEADDDSIEDFDDAVDEFIEWKIDDLEHPWRDEEILRHLYEEKGMTEKEIAEKLDVHHTTIGNWMEEHNIEDRMSSTEAMMNRWHDDYEVEGFDLDDDYIEDRIEDLQYPHRDEEVLRHLWEETDLPTSEIADGLGVIGKTIRKWTLEHDIRDKNSRRGDMKENDPVTNLDSDDDDYIEKKIDELRHPHRDEEVLRALRDKGLSEKEIGDKLDVNRGTISNWMVRNDIRDRMSLEEASRKGIQKQHGHDEDEGDGFVVPSPEPRTERERIEEKVSNQSHPWRSSIVLEHYAREGYTLEETADSLDTSADLVSSRADQYGVEFADEEIARFHLPDHVDRIDVGLDGDEVVVTAT